MARPAKLDLEAERHTPLVDTMAFLDRDLTDADFVMQVRERPEATISPNPLVSLATVTSPTVEGVRLIYAGTDTVENHIIAERLTQVPAGLELSTPLVLSQIGIRISEATVEAWPFPSDKTADIVFYWDIHITPSGGDKQKYAGGTFTVHPGATQ